MPLYYLSVKSFCKEYFLDVLHRDAARFIVVYVSAIHGCEIDVFTKRPCPSLAEAIMEQARLRDNTGLRC